MEQTGSKLGKQYITVYCDSVLYYTYNAMYRTVQPAYLNYMQSTSFEMLRWMKHKLKSRLLGEISITSDMQMTLQTTE